MNALSKAIAASWALSLAVAVFAAAPGDDAQRVFARVSPSVVTVRVLDEDGADVGQGSGVVIAAGLLATNCHVVREAASLRIVGQGGEFAGRWVRQDMRRDICIVAADGLSAPAAHRRASASVVVGEPVFAVGNPLGFGLAVSSGLITSVNRKDEPAVLIASAAQSPGSSGGGLFDRAGRLLGITTAVLGTGQNLNLVLSADGLEQLAVAGSTPRLPPPAPAPERRWEDEATALQRAGEWKRLESLARDWNTAQPSAAAALAFLGVAQQALDRNPEAATTLRRALDLDPHYAFAWLVYARALRASGRPAEASAALKQAEAAQPNYAEPPAERANWLFEEGHLDEAQRQIMESLRRAPGRSSAWRTLGRIEDARGRRSEALRAFQTALRLGEASADVGQRVTQALAGSGKADEASRVAAQAGLGKDEAARAEVAIGLAELQRNRLGAAEDALRKAIARAPDLPEAWNGLGSVLLRSNRAADAEAAYTQALALLPEQAEILTNRASARHTLGRREDTLDDLRRAIAIDPKYTPAWRLHGTVLMDARNFGEAASAFARVDALGQATVDDLVSLGESRAATGAVDAGLASLARAEAIDAGHLRMCLSTAKVLGNKGEIDKALTYLERALRIEPFNHVAWSSKGYALMKLGRLPEAVQTLETTVTLAPDNANSWINLGEVQLRSRNLGRAIQALEKAVVLAPQATDARLFLAQAYLGARLSAKSREQSEHLLARQPAFAPALGLLAVSYLQEGNVAAATAPYLRLKAVSPAVASTLRQQAIAGGLVAARQLPE